MADSKAPVPGEDVARQIRYWFREERRRLLLALLAVPPTDRLIPLEPGGWSVHDIVAHRLFWDGREAEALEQYGAGRRVELLDFPLRRLDGTNRSVVDTMCRLDTDALLRGMERARERMRASLAAITDESLHDPADEARILLGVALEHDREHRTQILAWSAQRRASVPSAGEGGTRERPAEPADPQ